MKKKSYSPGTRIIVKNIGGTNRVVYINGKKVMACNFESLKAHHISQIRKGLKSRKADLFHLQIVGDHIDPMTCHYK